VLVALALAGAALLWLWLRTFERTDDAQVDGHISPLSVRVPGTVAAVFVEDNQAVRRGDLLVELDAHDYQVALARAEAELAQARAQLEAEAPSVPIVSTSNLTAVSTAGDEVANADAAVAAAERDYQSAEARRTAARAEATRATVDEKRYRYLVRERAIPEERWDQVEATARTARAALASASALARSARKAVEQQRARRSQAESRQLEAQKNAPRTLDQRQSLLEARRAAVKIAEAQVARARLDLEYTRVCAPFDGVVGRRAVEPGQRVQPGEQLLALVDLGHLWVTANFKETQLGRLRIGQHARISVDALSRTIDGRVESFSPASGARFSLLPPENATGNFVKVVQRLPVRIRIAPGPETARRLRIGMSVVPRVRVR
jgi:membrane fusion protein (multidrug efflux system)